jgi:hypothetical protein
MCLTVIDEEMARQLQEGGGWGPSKTFSVARMKTYKIPRDHSSSSLAAAYNIFWRIPCNVGR